MKRGDTWLGIIFIVLGYLIIAPYMVSGEGVGKLTILNPHSHPFLHGNWSVRFITEGKSNLIIKPLPGTTWTTAETHGNQTDLMFLGVWCGNRSVDCGGSCAPCSYSLSTDYVKLIVYTKHTIYTSPKTEKNFSQSGQKAYYNIGDIPTGVYGTGETLLSDVQNLTASDDSWVTTTGLGEHVYQHFVFNVTTPTENITKLELYWEGHSGDAGSVEAYVRNFASSWEQVATHESQTTDFVLTAIIDDNIANYIDNNQVHLLVFDPSQTLKCHDNSPDPPPYECTISFTNFISPDYTVTSAQVEVSANGDLDASDEEISVYIDGVYKGKICDGTCSNKCYSYYDPHVWDVTTEAQDNALDVRCVPTSAVGWPPGPGCLFSFECQAVLTWTEQPSCFDNGVSCSADSDCCSGSCDADWDGVGSWCCDANQCSHDGTCYSAGTCQNTYVCSNGNWVNHCSNGVQDCDEEGVDCGGAYCQACCTPNTGACSADSECCSGSCDADWDGAGKWCCDANQCSHNGVCYGAGTCQDTYICSNGAWIDHCSNGVQDCDEEGVDCGGSSCQACNPPPSPPSNPSPASGTTQVSTSEVELSVLVSEPEGDLLDVKFYDALTGELIGEVNNVQSDTRASVTWYNLNPGKIYKWYATATDSSGATSSSPVWEFITVNPSSDWFDTNCRWREYFVFDNYRGKEYNVKNFTVLVVLNSSRINYSLTNKDDVRFYDYDGTPLHHEVETWNETGNSYIWVKIPNLKNSTDDGAWMYFNCSNTASYQPSAAWDNNYVAVWHLHGTNPNEVVDATSNNNDGEVLGSALEFDGKEDYVAVNMFYSGSNAIPATTVCAWTKTGNSGYNIVASWDRSEYWRLSIGDDTFGGYVGYVGWDTHTVADGVDDMKGNTLVNDNDWHLVCGTYDSASGTKRIYVDGKLDAESEGAHTPGEPIGSSKTRFGFIGVGSEADSFDGKTGPNNFFNGTIDEVRIYSRALSPEEIRQCYQGDCTNNGLVLYLPFSEGDGFTTQDISGQGNHGTLYSSEGGILHFDSSTEGTSKSGTFSPSGALVTLRPDGLTHGAVAVDESTTNKISTEGGAAQDWSKWSHWGSSYWYSSSQFDDPEWGKVFKGKAKSSTYLFDYYPYTVSAGHGYTLSFYLRSDTPLTGVSSKAYVVSNVGGQHIIASETKVINISTHFKRFTYSFTVNEDASGTAGIGLHLSVPDGVTIYAAYPQFEDERVPIEDDKLLFVKYEGNSGHPNTHTELMGDYVYSNVLTYEMRDGINIPSQSVEDSVDYYFLTWLQVLRGKEGEWQFAIDGDDAVELEIDGQIVASYYGGHGFCNCYTHSGTINLNGRHKLIVRHEEDWGGEGVILYFKAPGDTNWQVFDVTNLQGKGKLTVYNPANNYNLRQYDFIVNGFDPPALFATSFVDGSRNPGNLAYTPSQFGVDLNSNGWTIAGWFYPNEEALSEKKLPSQRSRIPLLELGTYYQPGETSITVWSTGGTKRVGVTIYDDRTGRGVPGSHYMSDGDLKDWIFVALRYDGSKLYLDTWMNESGHRSTSRDKTWGTPIRDNIFIGRYGWSGGGSYWYRNYWNERIDEVSIVSKFLTDSELNKLYESRKANTDKPAWTDETRRAQASGKIDGSGVVNGVDDWINTKIDENFQTGDFTVEAWVKPKGYSGRIVADDDNNLGWALSSGDPGNGALRFYVRGMDTTSLDTPLGLISPNNWYYVSGVFDKSNSRRLIYVNAKQEAFLGSDTGTPNSDWGKVIIGGESSNSPEYPNTLFDGVIDEVRLSNIARSSAWINLSYLSIIDNLVAFNGINECGEDQGFWTTLGIGLPQCCPQEGMCVNSSNECVVYQEEALLNGNCEDTLDNDCDGDVDSVDSGCQNSPPYPPKEPMPEDNAIDVPLETELSVNLTDPEGDNMNAVFHVGHEYDFSHGKHQAYTNTGDLPVTLFGVGETPIINVTNLTLSDDKFITTEATGSHVYQHFVFNISEEELDVEKLVLQWVGHSGSIGSVKAYVWNFATSSWEQVATHNSQTNNFVLNVTINESVSNYIENNQVHLLVYDPSQQKTLSCSSAGCTGSVTFSDFITPGCTLNSATLKTEVIESDYNSANEYVEWTKADGNQIQGMCNPGVQCACSTYYTCMDNGDVTSYAADNNLQISMKITSAVNYCCTPYLNARVTLSWTETCCSQTGEPCTSDAECCSGLHCAQDYDGGDKYCAPIGQCVHGSVTSGSGSQTQYVCRDSCNGCTAATTFSNFIPAGATLTQATATIEYDGDMGPGEGNSWVVADGDRLGQCGSVDTGDCYSCSACDPATGVGCPNNPYDVTTQAADNSVTIGLDNSIDSGADTIDLKIDLSYSYSEGEINYYDEGSCSPNNQYVCSNGNWVDHCNNGIQDCDEEGVDCGGAYCQACCEPNGNPCSTGTDCCSGMCMNGVCADPTSCTSCGTPCSKDDSAYNSPVDQVCMGPVNNECNDIISGYFTPDFSDCIGGSGQTADCDCDENCQAGYYCIQGGGNEPYMWGRCGERFANGHQCCQDGSEGDCISGHCNNGFCCDSGTCCNSDTDCPSGYYCSADFNCTPCPSDGCGVGTCAAQQWGDYNEAGHCELTCYEPDDSSAACENCASAVWSSTSNECCGDDGSVDNFCNTGADSCVNGVYFSDHCNDGVQNCDEEYVDCGGSCAPCSYSLSTDYVKLVVTTKENASGIPSGDRASILLSGLERDTKYYWYVVATDIHSASTQSEEWSFTTMMTCPESGCGVGTCSPGQYGYYNQSMHCELTCFNPSENEWACEFCNNSHWSNASNECCGDDGSEDNFCNLGYDSCVNGVYFINHCEDGIQNCDELDVDCNGSVCPTCGIYIENRSIITEPLKAPESVKVVWRVLGLGNKNYLKNYTVRIIPKNPNVNIISRVRQIVVSYINKALKIEIKNTDEH